MHSPANLQLSGNITVIKSAIPSATIVVCRDLTKGPEVLLVKRAAKSSFANQFVFPGGYVSSVDYEQAQHQFLTDKSKQYDLMFRLTATRELFEECGILLSKPKDMSNDDVYRLRQLLNCKPQNYGDIDYQHVFSAQNLHGFAHWETPLHLPQRWSTRFYMTQLSEHCIPSPDHHEVTDCLWIEPSVACHQYDKKLIKLPYPTLCTLKKLSEFTSCKQYMDWAKSRLKLSAIPILPEKHTIHKEGHTFINRYDDS